MRQTKSKQVVLRVAQLMVGLALPLVLLVGNLQLLAHPRLVYYEYAKTGFPPDTAVPSGGHRLTKAERTALAEAALQSIIGPQGMQALREARFQETGEPAFNEREVGHMRDVRWLFQRARVLFWVALVALLGAGAGLAWGSRRRDLGRQAVARPFLLSVMGTLSLAGALGVYILLSFGSFFTKFHHVFFEGDTWLFRRDDTLIRLFPTDFWFDAAILIAGLTIVELLAVGATAWWWERKNATADAKADASAPAVRNQE